METNLWSKQTKNKLSQNKETPGGNTRTIRDTTGQLVNQSNCFKHQQLPWAFFQELKEGFCSQYIGEPGSQSSSALNRISWPWEREHNQESSLRTGVTDPAGACLEQQEGELKWQQNSRGNGKGSWISAFLSSLGNSSPRRKEREKPQKCLLRHEKKQQTIENKNHSSVPCFLVAALHCLMVAFIYSALSGLQDYKWHGSGWGLQAKGSLINCKSLHPSAQLLREEHSNLPYHKLFSPVLLPSMTFWYPRSYSQAQSDRG